MKRAIEWAAGSSKDLDAWLRRLTPEEAAE